MRLGITILACTSWIAGCGDDAKKVASDAADTTVDTTADTSVDTAPQPDTAPDTVEDTAVPDTNADVTDTAGGDTTPAVADLACLGKDPAYETPAAGDIEFDFKLVDYVTNEPVPGVHGTFCARLDVNCTHPIHEADSDADGIVHVKVPAGFDGYIGAEGGGVAPTFLVVDPPYVTAPTPSPQVVKMVTPETAALLGQLLGVTFDATAGQVIVTVLDCGLAPAPGVTIEVVGAPDDQKYGYLAGGVPSPGATMTDETGAAGTFNLPPGGYTLVAKTADGKTFGRGRAFTAPGWITNVTIAPQQTTPDLRCGGEPELPVGFDGTSTASVSIIDFVTGKSVAGAHVKSCAITNLACATPLAEADTDSDGVASAVLTFTASGFDGFIDVTGTALFPARLFFNPPLMADGPEGNVFLNVLSLEESGLFAQISGATIDPELAQVAATAQDCHLSSAHGMVVTTPSLTASSKVIYLKDGLPAPAATVTDASGIAGMFNVAVGEAEFSTTFGGEPLGAVKVPLVKGYLNVVNVIPSK